MYDIGTFIWMCLAVPGILIVYEVIHSFLVEHESLKNEIVQLKAEVEALKKKEG